MKRISTTFSILGCIAIVGMLAYYVYVHPSSPAPSQLAGASQADSAPTLKPHRQAPTGSVEYYNEQYRFSLFYPVALTVKEYSEGGGATTVTFQDTVNGQGFQIFIVPYSESQVSDERFKKDVPSGVRENIKDITKILNTKPFFMKNTIIASI